MQKLANKFPLERVLQRELKDSRVGRRVNLAESIAIETGAWIHLDEAVCHIERLGAKLQFLTFPNLENSRQGDVELPSSRPLDISGAQISKRSQSGLCKRIGIQVTVERVAVAIGISEYLVRPLVTGLSR